MDGLVFDFDSLPLITQVRLTSFTGDSGGRVCLNTSKITPQQQKGRRETKNLLIEKNREFRCGLVALSMCLEHFGIKVSAETILEKARAMGFTKQGEMYSADYLAALTNEFLPNSSTDRNFPSAKQFSQSICDGSHFLIAYDCGPNYQPVQVKGHSAHWLLACGFVEKQSAEGFVTTSESAADDDIAIIGFQGKSTALNVFPFSEIAASNSQLLEAGAKRDPADYIIPDPLNLSEIRNCVVEIRNFLQNDKQN